MISIIIPVYNEEEILEANSLRVHDYLTERSIEHEVIVVSNGSTDRTNEIGKMLEQQHPWFRFFILPEKGPGRAFVHAVKESRYEYLITLDADLSSELLFIDYAKDLLSYGHMLVGSKSMGKQHRSLFRVLGSQFYLSLTLWCFQLTISDYSMGCKAFKRSHILTALPHLNPWTGYILELALFLNAKGKRVLQIGIECNDTRKSRFNIIHEGFYRFAHLYRSRKKIRDRSSWFHTTSA